MKQIITILIAMIFAINVWSQAPQKISYQAVVRNSSNVLVTNHTVGIRISIIQTSANGRLKYVETYRKNKRDHI